MITLPMKDNSNSANPADSGKPGLMERLYQLNLQSLQKKLPGFDLADILGRNANGEVHRGSGWFYFLPHIYGTRLLSNDVDLAIGHGAVHARQGLLHRLYLTFGKLFFEGHRQIIVNKAPLPPKERPVIFAPTHYFMLDPLSSIMLAERHAYLVFGTLPHFFNTFYGPEAYLNGSILLNRRNKANRHAVVDKAERVLKEGSGIIIFPEGGWNKSPNRLVLPLWRGVLTIAKRTGAVVVPMAHLLRGKKIYSTRLAPFEICDYSDEHQALSDLRDVMATGLWDLMEQFPPISREEMLGDCATMHEYCERVVADQAKTSGYYYDYVTEAGNNAGDLRLTTEAYPVDVWQHVADIEVSAQNIHHINHAKNLRQEDYQRRF